MTDGRRRFLRHFGEMLLAMLLGMALLGWPAYSIESTGVAVAVMAAAMFVPMAGWMRHRGHAWTRIAEMAGAMLVPAAALILMDWSGVLSGRAALDAQHAVMVPSMLAAMLVRCLEYSRAVDLPA